MTKGTEAMKTASEVGQAVQGALVAKAINEVMGEIKTLGKDEQNKFANYNFVSIDKFLGAVNPLCAKAGLIIMQDELENEIIEGVSKEGKKSDQMRTKWLFSLAHKTGDVWPVTFRRTVYVPAVGAQASGSAQSYALKQFLRSLLMIPTGDKDDADLKEGKGLTKGKAKAKEALSVKYDDAESIEKAKAMVMVIRELANDDALSDYTKTNAAEYAKLTARDQQYIQDELRIMKSHFNPRAAVPHDDINETEREEGFK